MPNKSELTQLLRESVLVRSFLAILVVGVASYAVIAHIELDAWYLAIGGTIIGFFFRGVSDQTAANAAGAARKVVNEEAAAAALATKAELDNLSNVVTDLTLRLSEVSNKIERPTNAG